MVIVLVVLPAIATAWMLWRSGHRAASLGCLGVLALVVVGFALVYLVLVHLPAD